MLEQLHAHWPLIGAGVGITLALKVQDMVEGVAGSGGGFPALLLIVSERHASSIMPRVICEYLDRTFIVHLCTIGKNKRLLNAFFLR